MFIVWGTKTRQEDGGVVGDWCDTCRTPNFHRLTHYFRVSHIYYIPLGKGSYAGTNRQCIQCGSICACNMASYSRALMHQEAYGYGIEQILQATNPSLLEEINKQRNLEYQIAQRMATPALPTMDLPTMPPTPIQTDQRMLSALHALGTLDARNKDVVLFMDRLQKWDYLTPSEREVLLHEIDAYITDDRKVNMAINLMRMLPTPTPNWMTCTGCFASIMLFIVGIASVSFLQSWLWGSLFFVTTVALWFFANNKATDISVRRWVQRAFIPLVRQRDVDIRYFVGLLAGIKENTGGYEEKIADMARNVDTIADELFKQGYLSPTENTIALPASPVETDVSVTPSVPNEEPASG